MKETPEALARAKQIFEYRDGKLFWKEKVCSKVVIGRRAGWPHPLFIYREVKINGVCFKEHRVIWAIHTGKWPEHEIDHINHVKDDNRIENLRDVTPSINQLTKPLCRNNTSGAKSVRWRPDKNKWQAYANSSKGFKSLGHFLTKEEAIAAREAYLQAQL